MFYLKESFKTKPKVKTDQVRWHTPIISVLEIQVQKDCFKSKASLLYTAGSGLAKATQGVPVSKINTTRNKMSQIFHAI